MVGELLQRPEKVQRIPAEEGSCSFAGNIWTEPQQWLGQDDQASGVPGMEGAGDVSPSGFSVLDYCLYVFNLLEKSVVPS